MKKVWQRLIDWRYNSRLALRRAAPWRDNAEVELDAILSEPGGVPSTPPQW